MVEDALGDHIGYFELRKTGSAGTAQVVRRERANAMLREGLQVACHYPRDELRITAVSEELIGPCARNRA